MGISQTTLQIHATILTVLSICVLPTRADDWPQWRGPNRDGVWNETGLITSFPADGVKIAWRTPVGPGWSSPVIVQGRVFLTDSELAKPVAKERIQCFEETTGKLLWSYSYGVPYPEWAFDPGDGPTATPIVEAGKVFMLGARGNVHCLDAPTGELLWEMDLTKEYQIREMMCRASPLIEGDLLILFTGAKPGACVLALDKATGKEVWKALDESVSNSSPLIVMAGGKRQLLVWTCESVTSLNPATGETYWREPMATINDDVVATPVVQNNQLLIGGLMMELNADHPAASVLWPGLSPAKKRILSNTSTALLYGDHVYSVRFNGEFVCLEADTGKLVWENDTITELKGGASIHLTRAGDDVFGFTDRGDLILAQVTPQGYAEKGRVHLLEPTRAVGGRRWAWSPPAYADRHIFVRNDEELVSASLEAQQGANQ